MHGDDVASAGVEVTTQIVSKATEILFDILKIAIEKERERKRQKGAEKSEEMSGGEVTYQRLKEGGEVTMLPSFAKEDYKELLRQATIAFRLVVFYIGNCNRFSAPCMVYEKFCVYTKKSVQKVLACLRNTFHCLYSVI